MKKRLLIALIILANFKNYAQKHDLGKVTIEELKEQSHPKDTSAVAAFLFNVGKTNFGYDQDEGFYITTDVDVKLKVYKKAGYQWANVEVPFYIGGSSKESVNFSKAVTYNLVNEEIVKTKLKSENEFTEETNKLWAKKKIVMPNVKEGSIVEYRYTIKSPYISSFPDWEFQKAIPVNYSEYDTNIPEYYTFNVYRKGSIMPIETIDKVSRTITLSNTEKTLNNGKGSYGKISYDNISYMDTHTEYKLENLPALKEEAFVNNIKNYAASVQHELSGKHMPQSPSESYSTTWEDVAKKIYDNEDFGSQLDKNNYFEEDIKTLLAGITEPNEKIATIYNFVKSRMNWDEFTGYLCNDGVRKAYQNKTGNCAEINLMLTAMLRYAGLDANPVLVSTRSNGIAYFPSRSGFNYVVSSVNTNDGLVLLDATSKIASPNILPIRDLNWFGRIIRKDGTSEMVDLMPKFSSSDVVNMLLTIDDKGVVSGKVREQYSDYYASKFRNENAQLSNESYLEKLEKENNNIEVSEYEVAKENSGEPIVEKYAVKSKNAIDIVGNKWYFSPLFHLAERENPFKQETREYPIDFSFPSKDKCMISITIPDGYKIESLPKSAAFALDKDYGSYKYSITNDGNRVQVITNLEINASIVPAEDYASLKEFFKMMIEKENEKIVLVKE